jgi:hypothetical protein
MVNRLTRDRVLHLVGRSRLDDHAVAEIVRLQATEPELVEAINRVMRGGEIGAERMQPMSRTVAALCEILASGAIDFGEPD